MDEFIVTFDSSMTRSAVVISKGAKLEWRTLCLVKQKNDPFPDARFNAWRQWAKEALDSFAPEYPSLVVYEKPTVHGGGSGSSQIMLEMTLRELCAIRKIPVKVIYPLSLKLFITGNGTADKSLIMSAMELLFEDYDIKEDEGGDIADALSMLCWARAGCPPSKAELKRLEKKQCAKKPKAAKRNPTSSSSAVPAK